MMTHMEEQKFIQAIQFFKSELEHLRTGRATPVLVEEIPISAYNTSSPLQQLAHISAQDARTLVIQPWDKSIVNDIEKSLQASSLGIPPVVSGTEIRLNFPLLTEERRKEIVKIVHAKAEETRVRVRTIREQILKTWKEKEREGEISEDAFARLQKVLQKKVDDTNQFIKDIMLKKEKEILSLS
ncbi:MAG: ribosome recycling factor [Candidatus Kerfeldbacteria bacterium RIFCSPHIGHO2_02_FULL_42_14]|uniref:Ribosome-recycling factor n=1 Tax=Candidatus Kerfeldbacteria bacterium RIFCSPHIGHO2_02_FULL_42_14 TaxID=1798540 RepID=A0A1G2ARD4_9BACT|nr:MAG: ribosome recycling factor [Candidatus Kerfeldbacteria bacterium RIFCSPHIGHO2_02_FULL_42_14]OGY80708.1 MAG: ribosome recycling factor [Candidatus Kerfeldbacteria bacterium RIFCSPHIGHO2_12_FULL_42_13]OGY82576.1 MAG: ribosome recycling factor [Candidatus Kerfeldbacteria bacterium RIFCSPLOWO2_02_FULL_42_19]OGY85238.1 MAG: ribosome recycling factor [Candidatus Kerfeldbacteria bacterium RIFCSPLOWO2_12_FULL_43_9]